MEAVTDRPAMDTTGISVVLTGLGGSDGVGRIGFFSELGDSWGCDTLVGFMVGDVVDDAPADVALPAWRGLIWSKVGAQEGGPEEQPTQLQATWKTGIIND